MTKKSQFDYRKSDKYESKSFPMAIKSIDEAKGIVEHIVAITGNIDDVDDRIERGAFAKTILERAGRIRVLDHHNYTSVTNIVGKPLELREVDRSELPPEVLSNAPDATGGLLARTKYAIETQKGREIFELVKGGYAPETSIGYDPIVWEYETIGEGKNQRPIRILKEIRLWEYSNVTWGANPATHTVSAKAKGETEKDEKPYDAFREDGKWVVYKVNENGDKIGKPLGTHDSEEDALAQIRALYAQEESSADIDPEIKAGRVLSATNAKRILSAVDALISALQSAGIEYGSDDDEKDITPLQYETAGGDNVESDTDEAEPTESLTSRRTRLKRLVELNKSNFELEVLNHDYRD